VDLVERYCKEQGLWRSSGAEPTFSRVVELDLSTVEPSMAGPRRPQDRVPLARMKDQWRKDLATTFGGRASSPAKGGMGSVLAARESTGTALAEEESRSIEVSYAGERFTLSDGAVVIAAITSCTNTSNPSVMLAAGLLARKAVEKGLRRKPWVKTSLAPGSKVVTRYLTETKLMADLERLGFHLVGYGCTTCLAAGTPVL